MVCVRGFAFVGVTCALIGSMGLAGNERTVTVVSWGGPDTKLRCDKILDVGVGKLCTANSLIFENHRVSLTMRVPLGSSPNAVVKIKDDCKAAATVAGILEAILSGKLSSSTASTVVEAFEICVEGHELYHNAIKNGAELIVRHEASFDSLSNQSNRASEAVVSCTVRASEGVRILDRNGWGPGVVIAADNGFIYWISGDSLFRSRYDGTLVAEEIDRGGWKGVTSISVENDVVYWIRDGDIFYGNLAAKAQAKILDRGGWHQNTKFSVDGGMIYWLDQKGYLHVSELSQPLKAVQLNEQNYSDIDGLSASAGNIFWQMGGDLIQRGACFEEEPSVVNRGGFEGGVSVAVDDGMLFWTAKNNLYSIPLEPSN